MGSTSGQERLSDVTTGYEPSETTGYEPQYARVVPAARSGLATSAPASNKSRSTRNCMVNLVPKTVFIVNYVVPKTVFIVFFNQKPFL